MILSVLEECYSAVRGVLVPYVRRVVLMSGSEFVTVSFGLKPGQPTLDLSFPLSIPPPSLSLFVCAIPPVDCYHHGWIWYARWTFNRFYQRTARL